MLRPALALLSAGLLSATVVTGCGVRFDDGPTLVLGGTHLRVEVVVPRLTAAQIHGSGHVDLDLGDAPAPALDLAVQGSGDVRAVGTVRTLRAAVQGSGDLDLDDLRATDADVTIQDSGDAHLRVGQTLHATIDGSGDIEYSGDPQVTSDLHGSGDLSRDG